MSPIIRGQDRRATALCGAVLLCAALLQGCAAVGPDFHPPQPAASRGFPTQALGDPGPGAPRQVADVRAELPADWWRLFQSDALDRLVEEAQAHNWSLAVTAPDRRSPTTWTSSAIPAAPWSRLRRFATANMWSCRPPH